MPKINFPEPPLTGNVEFDQYMLENHRRTYGLGGGIGDLDTDNINGELTDTKSHPEFTEVAAYQHHGTGDHDVLDQGADVANATASTLEITTADADATYGTPERDLINELKADFNLHIPEYNTLVNDVVNAVLASLRAANLID
jgi:hypothetical protein